MSYQINSVDFPKNPVQKSWNRVQLGTRGDSTPYFSPFWNLSLNFDIISTADLAYFTTHSESDDTFEMEVPDPYTGTFTVYDECSIVNINYPIIDIDDDGWIRGLTITFRVPVSDDRQKFHICYHNPRTVLSGTITTDPDYENIPNDRARIRFSSGTSSIPIEGNQPKVGNTVVIKDGIGKIFGYLRLRGIELDTPGDYSAGYLLIGENTAVPRLTGYSFEIEQDWKLWPIHPRTNLEGDTVVFYEDWDLSLTGGNEETKNWRPIANPGPPAVGYITEAQPWVTVKYVGEHSWATAPGASIASVEWYFWGTAVGVQTDIGTEASPLEIIYADEGKHLVEFRVTDTLGNQSIAYSWTWIISLREDGSPGAEMTDFLELNYSIDFNSGGGQANIKLYDNASDATHFQDSQLVVISTYGNQIDYNGWTGRENTWFVGYVEGGSVTVDQTDNSISFTLKSLDAIMKNTYCYPASLNELASGSTPANWTEGVGITVNRLITFIAHYRSTLAMMCCMLPLPDDVPLFGQDLGFGTLYGQLQNEVMNGILGGKVVFDNQGVLRFVRDYVLMTSTEKSAIAYGKQFYPADYVGIPDLQKRDTFFVPVSKATGEGVVYDGSGDPENALPLMSEAPSYVSNPFGSEKSVSRLALVSQAELNERTGLIAGKENAIWVSVGMNFINDLDYNIGKQNPHIWSIEADESLLEYQLSMVVIPRSVTANVDLDNQIVNYDVGFEPLTGGITAKTVDVPDPPAANGSGDGVPTEPPPPVEPIPAPEGTPNGDLLAGVRFSGVYYLLANANPVTWDDRNAGTIGGDEIRQVGFDPWWQQKGGSRPNTTNTNDAIIWACAVGNIYRSENCGITSWSDVTPTEGIPDDWEDTPSPYPAIMNYDVRTDNIHQNGHHYVLVNWTNPSSNYRVWLAKTEDDGQTWTWHSFAGSTQSLIFSEQSWDSITIGGSGFVPGTSLDYLDGTGVGIPEGQSLRAEPSNPADFQGATWKFRGSRPINRWNQPRVWYTDGSASNVYNEVGIDDCVNAIDDSQYYTIQLDPLKTVDYFNYYIVNHVSVGGGGLCSFQWETTQPAEMKGLWMDTDSEDGSLLYITLWSGGNLILQVRRTSDFGLENSIILGECSRAELDNNTYSAKPFTPPFAKDEVYVYGRMNAPAGQVGIQHLIKSTDQGVTWQSVENSLGTSHINAFSAGWDNVEAGKRELNAVIADNVGGNVYFYRGINELSLISGLEGADVSGTNPDAFTLSGSIAIGGQGTDTTRVIELDAPNYDTPESLEGDLPTGIAFDIQSLVYL